MARHYKQTRKDRRDESRGMKRYERKHRQHRRRGKSHDSDALMMPRDQAENHSMQEDTQMYHRGRSYYGPGYGHPANMPPFPDIKYYPKSPEYLDNDDYADTLREIDEGEDDDRRNLDRQPSHSMY